MSDLSNSVDSAFIRATALFSPTPHKIQVMFYVEGDDDIPFWSEALKPYQEKYNINVQTNQAVNNSNGGNGKAVLLAMSGLGENKKVAVDADYDLLIDNYSDYTDIVRENDYVVNTTWYSIENVLLQKTHCVQLLEEFSEQTSEFFACLMVRIMCGEIEAPTTFWGECLTECNIQKMASLSDFKGLRDILQERWKTEFEKHNEKIAQIKNNLHERGYSSRDMWKLMRGHNLWNMIVKPMEVKKLSDKISQCVKEAAKKGKPDKPAIMNSMGVYYPVKQHVERLFYRKDLSSVILPIETQSKLKMMFP